MRIVVTKRSNDYHACLENHPEIWGAGKNSYEAIGSCIAAHQDRFNIHIIQED